MTMTLGFSVRVLNDAATDRVIEAMKALAGLGACPFLRLVVPGTFEAPDGSYANRWSAKEAGADKPGYSAKRILHVTKGGKASWLETADAAPIFADMEAAGTYVGFPNSIAADRFYMLAPLSLPFPLRGAWLDHFPNRRYRLQLPNTLLDGQDFGTHLYQMLQCQGPMEATRDDDAESINSLAEQATTFFRCAQRHKLLTDFL